MPLRKRADGRIFLEDESTKLDKTLVAGDPSDSDPGYEVGNRMKCLELMSFITI